MSAFELVFGHTVRGRLKFLKRKFLFQDDTPLNLLHDVYFMLVMSMMVSFVLSFFPRDVLDEILNLIESVSEDFPSYSSICI